MRGFSGIAMKISGFNATQWASVDGHKTHSTNTEFDLKRLR